VTAGDQIRALRIAAWFFDRSADTKTFKRGMDGGASVEAPPVHHASRWRGDRVAAVTRRLLMFHQNSALLLAEELAAIMAYLFPARWTFFTSPAAVCFPNDLSHH
jgi:hypothetical protein